MRDTIVLSLEQFQKIVRAANDLGHNGSRVLNVYLVYGTAASGEPAVVWDVDKGPTSATRRWDER